MNKRFDIFTFLVVVLCVIAIFAFAAMMANAIRATAADIEAQEIMDKAQERIDLYYASLPARERPTDTVIVIEARPAVETPEPFPEPVEDWYIENLPLDKQLQKVVFDAACENGVDYFIALGMIQVESNFQVDAVSACGCYGLCQLNPEWFPSGLSPEENVRAGVEYLGDLLETYSGDVQAALTSYNAGYDTGHREYANDVLSASEDIMRQAGVVFP